MDVLNLRIPEHAYIFGLLQTDGHLRECTRNRSQITIELNARDKDILQKVQSVLSVKSKYSKRTRTITFKKGYEYTCQYCCLRVCNFAFKEHIKSLGLPVGKKSEIIEEPKCKFSKIDYYRGVLDGDGSLGITSKGLPFISLVTSSPELAKQYLQFIKDICGVVKTSTPNKRDGVYNIALFRELAQEFVKTIYYPDCFAMERKIQKSYEVLEWKRVPKINLYHNENKWTKQQDNFILAHKIEESVKHLNKTKGQVAYRRKQLQK